MERERIVLAIAKGRIMKDSLAALNKGGISVSSIKEDSRELVFDLDRYRILSCKPADVPKYVELGTADIGIVGSDCISESGCEIYEPMSLSFGKCKMVVAAMRKNKINLKPGEEIKVATKYPNITRKYFSKKKLIPNIIYLNGSVELAPIVGLSDVIVDITETGETIKKNDLKIIDTIMNISAKVIVNKTSLKVKKDLINDFLKIFKK